MNEITEIKDEVVIEKFGVIDDLFKEANKSGSGIISAEEAVQFFPRYGLSVQELGDVWTRTSVDNTLDRQGFVDYLKYVHVSQENLKKIFHIEAIQRKKLEEQFQSLQKKGIISAQDAYNFLVQSKLPREVLLKVWAVSDPTRKNFFDLSDFIVAMTLVIRKKKIPDFVIPRSRWPPSQQNIESPKLPVVSPSKRSPTTESAPENIVEKKSDYTEVAENNLLNIGDTSPKATTVAQPSPIVAAPVSTPQPNPRVETFVSPEVVALLNEAKLLKEMKESSKNALLEYQSKFEGLKKQAIQLKDKVENEKIFLSKLRSRRIEVQKESRQLSIRINLLENEIDFYREEREDLQDSVYEYEKQRNENIGILDQVNSQKIRYETDLQNERDHLYELEREIELQKHEMKEKDSADLKELQVDLVELRKTNEEKEEKRRVLKENIAQLDEKIEKLRTLVEKERSKEDKYLHEIDECVREKKAIALTITDYQSHLEDSRKFMKLIHEKEKKEKKKFKGDSLLSKLKKYLKIANDALRKYQKYTKSDKFFVEAEIQTSTPFIEASNLRKPKVISRSTGKEIENPFKTPDRTSNMYISSFSSSRSPSMGNMKMSSSSFGDGNDDISTPNRSMLDGLGTDEESQLAVFDQLVMNVSRKEEKKKENGMKSKSKSKSFGISESETPKKQVLFKKNGNFPHEKIEQPVKLITPEKVEKRESRSSSLKKEFEVQQPEKTPPKEKEKKKANTVEEEDGNSGNGFFEPIDKKIEKPKEEKSNRSFDVGFNDFFENEETNEETESEKKMDEVKIDESEEIEKTEVKIEEKVEEKMEEKKMEEIKIQPEENKEIEESEEEESKEIEESSNSEIIVKPDETLVKKKEEEKSEILEKEDEVSEISKNKEEEIKEPKEEEEEENKQVEVEVDLNTEKKDGEIKTEEKIGKLEEEKKENEDSENSNLENLPNKESPPKEEKKEKKEKKKVEGEVNTSSFLGDEWGGEWGDTDDKSSSQAEEKVVDKKEKKKEKEKKSETKKDEGNSNPFSTSGFNDFAEDWFDSGFGEINTNTSNDTGMGDKNMSIDELDFDDFAKHFEENDNEGDDNFDSWKTTPSNSLKVPTKKKEKKKEGWKDFDDEF